jgi:chaperone modulatory protein CbpM
MASLAEVAALCGVSDGTVRLWVEQRLVLPLQVATAREPEWDFSPADVARARFVRELEDDLGIQEDAIPVVLSLLDQVHGLRRQMRRLAEAVARLPEEQRDVVLLHIRSGGGPEV